MSAFLRGDGMMGRIDFTAIFFKMDERQIGVAQGSYSSLSRMIKLMLLRCMGSIALSTL